MPTLLRGNLRQSGIEMHEGTAAAPPYTFARSPTTGVYHHADGVVGFSANGSTVMTVSPDTVEVSGVLYGNAAGVYDVAAANVTGLTDALDVIDASSVTANIFVGDGGGLSNVPASNVTGLTEALDVIDASSVSTGNLVVGNVGSHFIPSGNEVWDLGSAERKWRDLYLSSGTLFLGNTSISEANGSVQVSNLVLTGSLTGNAAGLYGVSAANVTGLTDALDVIDATSIDTQRANITGDAELRMVSSATYQYGGPKISLLNSASGGTKRGATLGTFIRDASGENSYFAIDALSNADTYEATLARYDLTDHRWTFNTNNQERMAIDVGGQVTISGNISATSFVGDGSQLTNIPLAISIVTTQITDTSWRPLDDTALGLSGGNILVKGVGFQSGTVVQVAGTNATSTSVVDASTIRAILPAKAAGSYTVTVTRADGASASLVSGITYSQTVSWTTASNLGNVNRKSAFVYTLQASSDSAITYGYTSSLPPQVTLNSTTGELAGNITTLTCDTTYSFDIVATDQELQDSTRTFLLTVLQAVLVTIIGSGSTASSFYAGNMQGDMYPFGNAYYGHRGDNTTHSHEPYPYAAAELYGSLSGKTIVQLPSSISTYSFYALTADGIVHGWGLGPVGDGSQNYVIRYSPVAITEGSLAGKKVSYITIQRAIDADGTLHAWGYNTYGQLGDNTTTQRLLPVAITGGTLAGKKIAQVACGYSHTVAVATDGTVHAWGRNLYGEIGDNTTTQRLLPVAVTGGSIVGKTISSVACGAYHTFAIATDGTLHAWGYNSYTLGDGTNTNRLIPVAINGGSLAGKTVSMVAGGSYHSAALASDGTVHSWGSETIYDRPSPVLVNGGSLTARTVHQVVCGETHTFAISTDGVLHGWGTSDTTYIFGDGTYTSRNLPGEIQDGSLGGKIVSYVSVGSTTVLAVTNDGKLNGWGSNEYGEFGNATGSIHGNGSLKEKTIVDIACGAMHGAAVATDGTLHAWGLNSNGQVGDNTTTNRRLPVAVSGSLAGKTMSEVACGGYHTVSVATDGTLHAWGQNTYGQLGDNTTTQRLLPVAITGGSLAGKKIAQVACGGYHTVAVATDGTLHVWGYNTYGQLGDNTTTQRLLPITYLLAGKTIAQVACGYSHTVAVATDGTVHAWGRNLYGEIGDNTTTQRLLPVAITGGSLAGKKIAQVACGGYHTVAVATDRTLHAWGQNTAGQVGDNTTTQRNLPVAITGGSLTGKTVNRVVGFYRTTVALATDGTVHVWGSDISSDGYMVDSNLYSNSQKVPVQLNFN